MKFSTILKFIKAGYNVKRENWEDGYYWKMVNGALLAIRISGTKFVTSISVNDIFADDWKVIEE